MRGMRCGRQAERVREGGESLCQESRRGGVGRCTGAEGRVWEEEEGGDQRQHKLPE